MLVKGYELERVGEVGVRLKGKEALCIDFDGRGCDHHIFTGLHSSGAKGVRLPQELRLGEFSVKTLSAYSREDLGVEPRYKRGESVGYVVRAGDLTLYHPGASELVEEMIEVRSYNVTVMIVPLGEKALTPEEAFEAVKTVRPAVVVPIMGREEAQKFKLLAYPYTQVIFLHPQG